MLTKTSKSNTLSDSMGFVFINEASNLDSRDISSIKVNDSHGVFYVSFEAALHSFDVMNRNNRKYLGDNVWQAITKSDKIQSLLADNAWYGEMNHPTQYFENKPLSPNRLRDIAMENRSHKIMSPRIQGNLLKAHIETASGTEAGVGFGREVIQGLHPAFSCRALAVMESVNGVPTVYVRQLITYDWVLYPSHKEAHIITEPKLKSKIVPVVTESTGDNTVYYSDFIMPLKDILNEAANSDANMNAIMESFELSYNDIVGIDKSHRHVIVKDADNRIYANISPMMKHRVDDFFNSL